MAIGVGVFGQAVASGTSVTTPGVASQAAGSTFVHCQESDVARLSFGDNKGNTYTDTTASVTAAGLISRMSHVQNGVGGAGHTFTFATTGSADLSIYYLEITGGLTSGILDQVNQGADAATPFGNAISITTTQADELLVAYLCCNSATTPATHAESTGMTIGPDVTTGGPNWTGCVAYRVLSATGSYNASFTENGGTSGAVHIASFKALPTSVPVAVAWVTA